MIYLQVMNGNRFFNSLIKLRTNMLIKKVFGKAKKLAVDLIKKIVSLFKKKTIIWMIGDSTMCIYDASFAPLTGWGMPFANYFIETVIVKNKARSGYSTKTFIGQQFWQMIYFKLKKDDYVLIQFGHNDENSFEKSIYTSPEEYANNLLKFIKDTRAKKANPILLTPVARREFDENERVRNTHYNYSNKVKEIAKQQNVSLIDLDKLTRSLLEEIGDVNSKMLFNYLLPNENPHYPNGLMDDVHFNEFGARKVAQLVLSEINKQQLSLIDKIAK